MGSIGTPELIVILVIALVIFGPGKLPEVGKAIGKGINEFKDALSGPRKLMIRRYYYVQRLRLW